MSEDVSENNPKKEISLKILLIGDSRVGKTSLLTKYMDNIFPEEHIATIGVEYKEKPILKNGFNIKIQIWDTAGEERFHSITKNIYRNTNGVLFVFDVTEKDSFSNVKNWIKDTENIDKEIKGVILGNKIDLANKRVISKEDIEELGNKFGMPVLECSAKDNINVSEGVETLIDELLKGKSDNEILEMYCRKIRSDLSISSKKTVNKKKGGCC
jgi:small GTP-binding protein